MAVFEAMTKTEHSAALPPLRPKILLVDDDERGMVAVSEALSGLGADVVCASSGVGALRLVLRHEFAVILLDVRMPDMDGYETAALIRQRAKSRRIPLIFLTAVDKDMAHVFRGYSAGAVDYVFKPIEPVILRAKVTAFLELFKQAEEIWRQTEQQRLLLEDNIRMRAAKMEAEFQLRASEARQSVIIRSLPIALYEASVTDGGTVRNFVYDNVGWLLGFEASAFTDDRALWASRVHPEDWQGVAAAIGGIAETGGYSVQYRWTCADGSHRYFLDQGVIAPGQGEETPRIFGTMLDVHDRRLLEQQLAHTQKMEAIGRLTGGIAHDFSNMLMVIIGNLDRIRRAGVLDEPTAGLLDLALQGAMHCRDVTKRLVSFARQQALASRPVNFNDLINGLTDLLERTLSERIKIRRKLTKDLWNVRTDPAQMEAAVVNLVVNSRDAMPHGGIITIRTANVELGAGARKGPDLGPGSYVLLEVADTGTGMTKDVLARALEPFFTTKEVGRGSGLGLSTTYGFVKQSGGDLVIESEPDRGATVRIYLPRHESAGADGRTGRPSARRTRAPLARRGEVILAVEDDVNVRRTAAGMLRDLGYRVIEAEDAAAALEAMERADNVDLLFADIVMPGPMNGFQLGAEALRRRPGLKILYTSAHAGERVSELAGDALAPLLRKPYRDHELAQAIRTALR